MFNFACKVTQSEAKEAYLNLEKANMNLVGIQSAQLASSSAISLFHSHKEEDFQDPLQTLILEGGDLDKGGQSSFIPPKVVKSAQFPDQSIYTLNEQLMELKRRVGRLKIYLEEVEVILPIRNN